MRLWEGREGRREGQHTWTINGAASCTCFISVELRRWRPSVTTAVSLAEVMLDLAEAQAHKRANISVTAFILAWIAGQPGRDTIKMKLKIRDGSRMEEGAVATVTCSWLPKRE